jgi:hypothetical protein
MSPEGGRTSPRALHGVKGRMWSYLTSARVRAVCWGSPNILRSKARAKLSSMHHLPSESNFYFSPRAGRRLWTGRPNDCWVPLSALLLQGWIWEKSSLTLHHARWVLAWKWVFPSQARLGCCHLSPMWKWVTALLQVQKTVCNRADWGGRESMESKGEMGCWALSHAFH